MAKGILYASPRTTGRHEKGDYARALELFQSNGYFAGDPVLVAHVMTHCFDRRIPFKWGSAGGESSMVTRERDV